MLCNTVRWSAFSTPRELLGTLPDPKKALLRLMESLMLSTTNGMKVDADASLSSTVKAALRLCEYCSAKISVMRLFESLILAK